MLDSLSEMNENNPVSEHNRLFEEASTIIQGQIPVHGQSELPPLSWLGTRKLRQAISLYERVLEINPSNGSALWLLGKIHQRFRDILEALSWVRAFTSKLSVSPARCTSGALINPGDAGLRANLALAYLLAGTSCPRFGQILGGFVG